MSDGMKAALLYGARDIRVEAYRRPELQAGMVLLRTRRVGICGSDLHYYQEGHCGASMPDRPFILGHEFTAEVAAVADGVDEVRVGQRVTANPARACGFCDYCKAGRGNLCRKTIMLGSASTRPPTNGAMAEYLTVRGDQCHVLPDEIDDTLGTMIEPFAVALHAVKRAGGVSGKRVFVAGAGTIGRLVAITAKAFGAAPVAVSEIVPARRERAVEGGVDAVLDPNAKDFDERVQALAGDGFDALFEASGSAAALRQLFDLVRPGGTIVQIGTVPTDDIGLPGYRVMNKEISYVGSMRYGNVFGEAIRLVASGRVDLRPLYSGEFNPDESAKAFECAADKARSLKVQIQL
jgi:L-idonate 5-dehydrogenase